MSELIPEPRFPEGIDGLELSGAVALRALAVRAPNAGWVPVDALIHAIRDEYRRLEEAPELPIGDLAAAWDHPSEEDGIREYVERQVLQRLETEGLVECSPEEGVRLSAATAADPERLIARIDARIVDLVERQTASSETAQIQEAELGTAVALGGSTLSAKGLVKTYRKRRVVNEVDLEVSQGEIVGLLGPNGAGKTTTFYMMVGLIAPDAGRVTIGGADVTKVPMYKRARRGHRLPRAGAVRSSAS